MASKDHDEWCPLNGCRCGKCGPCAEFSGCVNPLDVSGQRADSVWSGGNEDSGRGPDDVLGLPGASDQDVVVNNETLAAAWRDGWLTGNRWAFEESDADDIEANPHV